MGDKNTSKMSDQTLEEVVVQLHDISGIKFGSFKLKGGIMSPVYFDLRVIISKPKLLQRVSELLWNCNPDSSNADVLCGVPYTALPLAALMSVDHDVPSIIRRKEVKAYGTKKVIEGDFQAGQKCLIVEDVITSGSSVLETAAILLDHGLIVEDVVVFLDRQQGGRQNLENNGIRVHCVTDVTKMMSVLEEGGRVSGDEAATVLDFVRQSAVPPPASIATPPTGQDWKLPYEKRAGMCSNPTAKLIFSTMAEKKSNLCVAVDVTRSCELLRIAAEVGPHVFAIKTHVDMIEDWSSDTADQLKEIAKKHDFLLFEDRKFADIGQTVSSQFKAGPFSVHRWCNLVTVHGIAGPGVVQGLGQDGDPKGALIVAQMSSKDNLISEEYSGKCVEMFRQFNKHPCGVATVGLIAQTRLCPDADCVQMTPGVSLTSKGDNLGQTYVTVEEAVISKGADAVIVGRGITSVENELLASEAKKYQEEEWAAYLKRAQDAS